MDENGKSDLPSPRSSRRWIRRLLVVGAVLLALLVIFHRPILRHLVRSLAIHFAARENLKLDFQIEGSVLGGIVLRNVHGTGTAPSPVESIDADLIRADYSLFDLIFRGQSDLVKNVELHSASIVLNPGKSQPPPPSKPNEKVSLPAVFPEQVHCSNVNLTIHSQPQDFVLRNLNLELDPRRDGALRIDKLQIPNVHTWTNVTAATS